MKKAIVAAILAALTIAANAETTRRDRLKQMFAAMGGPDLPEQSTQYTAFDRNLSDADIDAVIAFYQSPAGQHLSAATRAINKAAMVDLEAAIARSKQKRTSADLQTIAVAVEAYAIDNKDLYPPTSNLDELSKLITPTYLRSMVRLDGWGKEYIYISDTKNYRILSAGADGRLSPDSQKIGVTKGDFGDDLIFENGGFVHQ